MDDTRQPDEGRGPSFQGPHWQRAATLGELKPLRLILQPSGLVLEVSQPDTLVGRHSSADVRLPLPDVSRQHCRFLFEAGRWQIRDLNSLNGVYVNDVPVHQAVLRHGDRVRIGGFTFEVDYPEATADSAHGDNERTTSSGEVLRSIADALPPETVNQPPKRQAS